MDTDGNLWCGWGMAAEYDGVRVVNAAGQVSLRGFPGPDGFQRHLLEEEGVPFSATGRIDLEKYGWRLAPRARRRR